MIRLILLILLSSSPHFFANAQNLTDAERRFLGGESTRYLNAYRYPQRKVESGSSSTQQITNRYLNQKIQRGGTIVVKSHEDSLEPIVQLSELPTVEKVTLPSDQVASGSASLLPQPVKAANKVVAQPVVDTANAEPVVANTKKIASLDELKQQEQRLKNAVDQMHETPSVAKAAEAVTAPVAAATEKVTEVIESPIPVKVSPEAVKSSTTSTVTPVAEVDKPATESSKQVEELRALIEKLKQSKNQ